MVPRIRCLDCPGQPRFSNDCLSTHSRLFPWVSRYGDDKGSKEALARIFSGCEKALTAIGIDLKVYVK